jgi:outer membrane protein OmpA-like peptidoglycan-associated protein
MKIVISSNTSFPRRLSLILLASAISIPAIAQQNTQAAAPSNTPAVTTERPSAPTASASDASTSKDAKEGFWGRVNPFARKKWVNKRVDPLKDRLSELDEVNAKNSRDIQDVDSRAQAGIRNAQSAADAANQTATAAGDQARRAGSTAQGAFDHVDKLNSTVTGLDQYRQASEVDVAFHGGQPILSAAARKQLDDFAASLAGRQGYILEIEGHSPATGGVGIQNSSRLADAVKRYLVTQHEIPVYRLHSVALGNAPAVGEEDAKPAKTSSVHVRLMENSLAAQEDSSPHGVASSTSAERP